MKSFDISFGHLAFNQFRLAQGWIRDICRYKWLRFFGYSSRRVFIGVIVTSNTAAPLEEQVERYESADA